MDEPTCRVAYAEGGEGWWPQSSLFATEEERRVAEAPQLADRKARSLAALAERRRRAETSGVVIGGMGFSTDVESQAKLTAVVVASVLDNEYAVRWKLSDGSFASLDHAALIAAAQGVRAHVQACFDREAALVQDIAAAADLDALAAIDIASGWPDAQTL
ncbi:DUF4376 domain-containing protein [Methylosinus sp. 3S-1]|uniref:DUF4376 domain-containing protein n=1 Tax=Methylosinus sp. 3S-1 TaxID=1849840 RepID=UPI00138AE267|nr:DUF4376 domain-containing protein [Methylosinus sp. 3S-1]